MPRMTSMQSPVQTVSLAKFGLLDFRGLRLALIGHQPRTLKYRLLGAIKSS